MNARRILALLVVLALSFVLLSATASSARQAHVNVAGQGTAPPIALKDDGDSGGDDDRWGDMNPYDPEQPDPDEEGEGDEGEGNGGGGVQGTSRAFEALRMQLSNILWRLKFMLAVI